MQRVLTAFVVLTFLFQGYIAQTHIHWLGTDTLGRHVAEKSTPRNPAPSKSDEANCPLCQAVLHVGAFSLASAIVLLPPRRPLTVVNGFVRASVISRIVALGWQPRAPPVF